jgi:ketosteroid isomerase-like protein
MPGLRRRASAALVGGGRGRRRALRGLRHDAGVASATVSVEEDRAELARVDEDWMRAMQERDEEALEQIVAQGFRFTAVHLHPDPMNREQWMEAAMGGYHIVSFAYESMDIDVFGDTGIVHARYSQMANFDAVNLSNAFSLTDVWSRIDGRWQVVARHSSVLT